MMKVVMIRMEQDLLRRGQLVKETISDWRMTIAKPSNTSKTIWMSSTLESWLKRSSHILGSSQTWWFTTCTAERCPSFTSSDSYISRSVIGAGSGFCLFISESLTTLTKWFPCTPWPSWSIASSFTCSWSCSCIPTSDYWHHWGILLKFTTDRQRSHHTDFLENDSTLILPK
jgi:hypothetical protein